MVCTLLTVMHYYPSCFQIAALIWEYFPMGHQISTLTVRLIDDARFLRPALCL